MFYFSLQYHLDAADLQELLQESSSSSKSTIRAPIKRGRPRKDPSNAPKTQKIIDKIEEAINNHHGQPILYASTTKGTMKLIFDGHHFRYSFRKGSYTIFQCCYKEIKEECPVRVVTDQKLVFPLDGEHIHFVQATDKSVTSVKFTPGEEPEPEFVNITAAEEEKEVEEVSQNEQDHVSLNVDDIMPQPIPTNVKEENVLTRTSLEFTKEICTDKTSEPVMDDKPKEPTDDPNEFREKIKKRLQKALLGKKKQ